MAIRTWEKLACFCGNESFKRIYNISWHENQGTSEKPNGWECEACGKKVQASDLIEQQKLKKKQWEFEKLKKDLEAKKGIHIKPQTGPI